MREEILLTVAIPNYNGGENLIRAIRSCRNINLPVENFEILLVDNCSTDNSVENARKLLKEFPNLRIEINEKNIGRVGNWNRCLDLARGKYLIFLFVNDEISIENSIIKNLNKMEHEKIGICVSSYYKNDYKIIVHDEIQGSMYFIESHLNKFSFPFAPIQKNIYNLNLIRQNNIKFNEFFELNGDQLFSIEVALKSKLILFSSSPQIKWNFSTTRFHSKVTLFKVINEDYKLLEYLINTYKINVNYSSVLCYMLNRILREREWKRSAKINFLTYSFFLEQLIRTKNINFLRFCIRKIYEKLRRKLNV